MPISFSFFFYKNDASEHNENSFSYCPPPPILCKDSANREENKMNIFIFYPEMQPILSKDSANRIQYKANLLDFIVEMQPI